MFGVIALVLASCVEFELGRSQVAMGKVVMQWQYLTMELIQGDFQRDSG